MQGLNWRAKLANYYMTLTYLRVICLNIESRDSRRLGGIFNVYSITSQNCSKRQIFMLVWNNYFPIHVKKVKSEKTHLSAVSWTHLLLFLSPKTLSWLFPDFDHAVPGGRDNKPLWGLAQRDVTHNIVVSLWRSVWAPSGEVLVYKLFLHVRFLDDLCTID